MTKRQCIAVLAIGIAAIGAVLPGIGAYGQMSGRSSDAAGFWRQPLAPQGEPPSTWSKIEQSLSPSDCGQCHAEQFAQWQTSRHAHAFSPGLARQLLSLSAVDAAECLQCHAPLAEQRIAFEAARAHGDTDLADHLGLSASGNGCGGCHVRGYHRFGPPERGTGAVGQSAQTSPHGGVLRTAAFEQSDFCNTCHQFSADTAVNGKPLQNTYVEWRASPQAVQGMSCQSCHMPDRAHVWRGIHDSQMVAKGLTPAITADAEKVRFELVNSGVGHAFPTYTVPKVVMNLVALDADGASLPQTLRSYVIARRVRYDDAANAWLELSDTRLLPGQSAAIELAWNGSERIRAWLDVIPDDFYATQVFPELIKSLPMDGEARRLANEALMAARASSFTLYETELLHP